MSGFIGPAVLLVLAAALFVVWPLLRQRGSAGNAPGSAPGSAPERRGALLTALAIAAVAAALYGVLHAGAGGPAEATSTNANGTASGPAESDTIVSLVRSTQRHPDDVQSWLDLGRAYLRANQW